MAAFWLTYKPLSASAPKGWPVAELQALVKRFQDNPNGTTEWWRIAASRLAAIGDRVYLFKQGDDPRGIFGVGTIIDGPTRRDGVPQALIHFDQLVDPTNEFLLSMSEIVDIIPASRIDANSSGTSVPEVAIPELENRLAPRLRWHGNQLSSDLADDAEFDPDGVVDERQRSFRAIRMRRGQTSFREALLKAYAGRCAVTGCSVADVLEAAHITPHMGPLTNHVSNGILLRADIHTLFDCGLISIDPQTRRIVTAEALDKSSYSKLSGRVIRAAQHESGGPSRKALTKHFLQFNSQYSRGSNSPSVPSPHPASASAPHRGTPAA